MNNTFFLQLYHINTNHFHRTNPDSIRLETCPLKLADSKVNGEYTLLEFNQSGLVGNVVAYEALWNRIDKCLITKHLFMELISDQTNLKVSVQIANYLGYSATSAAMDLANLKTADQMSTISPTEGLRNYAQVRANMVDFFSKRFGW